MTLVQEAAWGGLFGPGDGIDPGGEIGCGVVKLLVKGVEVCIKLVQSAKDFLDVRDVDCDCGGQGWRWRVHFCLVGWKKLAFYGEIKKVKKRVSFAQIVCFFKCADDDAGVRFNPVRRDFRPVS